MSKFVLFLFLAMCLIPQGCSTLINKQPVKPVVTPVVAQVKAEKVSESVFVRASSGAVADPNLVAIYFDYDRSNLRPNQISRLQKNVDYLKKNPSMKIVIGGHCDERGTAEYNLSLGAKRAATVADYFVKHGVDKTRISVISYGEDCPVSPLHSESGWSLNRRAEFKKF